MCERKIGWPSGRRERVHIGILTEGDFVRLVADAGAGAGETAHAAIATGAAGGHQRPRGPDAEQRAERQDDGRDEPVSGAGNQVRDERHSSRDDEGQERREAVRTRPTSRRHVRPGSSAGADASRGN
jgi:hypothetical protein